MKYRIRGMAEFLLTVAVALSALGQTAADISQYPSLALLPGKGPTNIWSGLPAKWAQRHKEWAGHGGEDRGAIVFLGDSITEGWHSLTNDFPRLHVVNRGIGGDTTRGVLYRLKADVLDLDPKAIVLLIGTNDVGNGADPDDVAANIRQILADIKAFNPHVPVVVCKVMPRYDRQIDRAGKLKKLNGEIEAEIKGDPEFALCDTWSPFADAEGHCLASEFPDLLHPNEVGYAKWHAALELIFGDLKLTSPAQN